MRSKTGSSQILRAIDRTEEFKKWQADYLKD